MDWVLLKKTITKYLWSVGATSDTTPQRQTLLNYAYPNSIRRKVPETGTDNVTLDLLEFMIPL